MVWYEQTVGGRTFQMVGATVRNQKQDFVLFLHLFHLFKSNNMNRIACGSIKARAEQQH